MQMFVKKNSRIDIDVFAWEDERGNVDATHDRAQVPDKVTKMETLIFTFRRPTYQDSTAIMRQAKVSGEGSMDIADFQDTVLRTLLVDWNLKDEEGQAVSVRSAHAVNSLQPAIARAACAGCLEKVSLF